jgi:hypothetical protein
VGEVGGGDGRDTYAGWDERESGCTPCGGPA